jgi:hypothetical protein
MLGPGITFDLSNHSSKVLPSNNKNKKAEQYLYVSQALDRPAMWRYGLRLLILAAAEIKKPLPD